MGKLIVFEGLNKTGKTTLINVLNNKLKEKGLKVAMFKEPVTNKPFDKFYNILDFKLDNDVLFFLMNSNRLYGQDILKNLLKENDFVLCDRYYYSTLAYQVLNQKNEKLLKKIMDIMLQEKLIISPDLIFYLKITTFDELKKIEKRVPDKTMDKLEDVSLNNKMFSIIMIMTKYLSLM